MVCRLGARWSGHGGLSIMSMLSRWSIHAVQLGPTLFLLDRKLQRKHSSHAVVEGAKISAGEIVLNVARIEVISNVEDLEAPANPVLL